MEGGGCAAERGVGAGFGAEGAGGKGWGSREFSDECGKENVGQRGANEHGVISLGRGELLWGWEFCEKMISVGHGVISVCGAKSAVEGGFCGAGSLSTAPPARPLSWPWSSMEASSLGPTPEPPPGECHGP